MFLTEFIRNHVSEARKEKLKTLMERFGFEHSDWVRIVMYRECRDFIESLNPPELDVLEISGGRFWDGFPFKSFTKTEYPAYDICDGPLDQTFDLIIADQVWEHLLWPYRAARNVHAMLKPGGTFVIATPFLVRRHDIPVDCSRWTEIGMKHFLAECGFDLDKIETGSWGNRACVKANFNRWAKRGLFGSLKNEPNFPVMVWAFARK